MYVEPIARVSLEVCIHVEGCVTVTLTEHDGGGGSVLHRHLSPGADFDQIGRAVVAYLAAWREGDRGEGLETAVAALDGTA